eukprot:NODE_2905_length_847_cov_57.457393_g2405_i0.p1 GENE.NODE_2905_length_847_cov_57.457393_g2405_i0~~NODE_2905_length_847_cov_57.457393_g2405_i0.p1  ORF type:complete len:133 (+),score=22.25 NODE_2905_length_847_cov_57.457393_g2405_i0:316-714(+)
MTKTGHNGKWSTVTTEAILSPGHVVNIKVLQYKGHMIIGVVPSQCVPCLGQCVWDGNLHGFGVRSNNGQVYSSGKLVKHGFEITSGDTVSLELRGRWLSFSKGSEEFVVEVPEGAWRPAVTLYDVQTSVELV